MIKLSSSTLARGLQKKLSELTRLPAVTSPRRLEEFQMLAMMSRQGQELEAAKSRKIQIKVEQKELKAKERQGLPHLAVTSFSDIRSKKSRLLVSKSW